MVELTSNLLGNTLVYTIAMGVFSIGVTAWNLWLQTRQAKIKGLTEKQISILEKIEINTRRC